MHSFSNNGRFFLIASIWLLLASFSHADFLSIDFSPVTSALSAVQGSVGSVQSSVNQVGNSVNALPNQLLQAFTHQIKLSLGVFAEGLAKTAKAMLLQNPIPSLLENQWQLIITIIGSFYGIAFAWVGYQFLTSSFDPIRRAQAKEQLTKIVFMMLLVGLSLPVYELLLALSSTLSTTIWNTSLDAFFSASSLSTLNIFLLVFFVVSVLAATVTFFIRYWIVLSGILVFPIAISLFFIRPTRVWGKMGLSITFIGIFLPFLDSVLLLAFTAAPSMIQNVPDFELFYPSMGFVFMSFVNWFVLQSAFRTIIIERQLGG